MQKLNVRGKLLLGMVLTLASAAPLACSDDDSNGVMPNGTGGGSAASSGEGGNAGTAQAGKGGTAASGGTGATAGTAPAGAGGVGTAGAAEMGGAMEMGGEAGAPVGMAGEGGMAGAAPATYEANGEAICTVEGTIDCDATQSPAQEKQDCLDSFQGILEFAPNCVEQIKDWAACLAPNPASSYSCADGSALPDVCNDEAGVMYECFLAR